MEPGKSVLNWSGGKDSALALHRVLESGTRAVSCLLTTVNETYDRVSMHGVRTPLMQAQASEIGIPLMTVMLPEMPDMPTYERIMEDNLVRLKGEGIRSAIFGDIFLEDLRKYREDKLAAIGMECVFPLWKIPTDRLIDEFIRLGFKAIAVCVDERFLDRRFAGREIDRDFVNSLPENVDPCGENGEFHTFVYDGPIFKKPVKFTKGEIVYRKYSRQSENKSAESRASSANDPFDTGFWYCDLLPVTGV